MGGEGARKYAYRTGYQLVITREVYWDGSAQGWTQERGRGRDRIKREGRERGGVSSTISHQMYIIITHSLCMYIPIVTAYIIALSLHILNKW